MATTFNPPPYDQLATVDLANCDYNSDLVEIIGVVSFASQGAWSRTDEYDVHCFEFAAWRRPGQQVIQSKITLLRPVPAEGDRFSEYPAGSIHQVRVLLTTDETRAVFAERIRSSVADPELQAIADKLQQPVTINTERYGVLTLDRRINWFEGQADWNGEPIDISFETDVDLGIASQLETADALFAAATTWDESIREFAVNELLELANDWQEERETPVTQDEFLNCMVLESISIKRDGEFEFWHDDGDLFWGHSIQISGSLEKGVLHATIAG